MPFGTKDIGGGVQQLAFSGGEGGQSNPLEDATKTLGLLDLANRVQQGPVDTKIKQLDAALKSNQLLMTDITNESARVELQTKRNEELRQQFTARANMITSIPDVAGVSPEGAAHLVSSPAFQQFFPGTQLTKGANNSVALLIPGDDGKISAYAINGKPEQVAKNAEQLRTGWEKVGGGFGVVAEFKKNFDTNIALASGAGDTAAIFSYMKMLDRNNSVREGQFAKAEDAPGVSQAVLNMYNRALSSKSPILGPPNSPSRKQFIVSADGTYTNAKDIYLTQARFYRDAAPKLGVDPGLVVTPFGGIGLKELNAIDGIQEQGSGGASSQLTNTPVPGNIPKGSGAKEASVIPSKSEPGAPAPLKFKTTDELMRENLFNGWTPGSGR